MRSLLAKLCVCVSLFAALTVQAQSVDEHVVKQKKISVGTLMQMRNTSGIQNPGAAAASEATIDLPLFDGQTITLVQKKIEERAANDYSWFGYVEGYPSSLAILVVKNGNITGQIEFDGKQFEINPTAGSIHNLSEIDLTKLPSLEHDVLEEEDPLFALNTGSAPSASGETENPATAAPFTGEAQTINVLAVYSIEAADRYPDIQARIQLAVDYTNLAYANSGIVHRVNLAAAVALDHNETGDNDELWWIQDLFDGRLDEVHALREQYDADVISFWAHYIVRLCGQADSILSDAVSASHITRVSCGGRTFAHELGHNQGARHNLEQDRSISPFPYGHGAGSVEGRWRTIMSYSNACGSNCRAIQYFSTPEVIFAGEQLGSAESEDNARVINETGEYLAGFSNAVSNVNPTTVEAFSTDGRYSVALEEIYPGTWFGNIDLVVGETDWMMRVDGETHGAVEDPSGRWVRFLGEMSADSTDAVPLATQNSIPLVVMYDERYGATMFYASRPSHPSLYFRGTPNNWDTSNQMTYIGGSMWMTHVVFDGQPEQRFKFDVHGDWTQNYGASAESPSDTIAEGGDDIYTGLIGAHRVYVNTWTEEYWIVAAENLPPVAVAGPDLTVGVGQTFTLDGSASFDPDGVIDSYYWDFIQVQGEVVEHTFNSVGEVTITLIVRDNEGAVGTDAVVVTITDDPQYESVQPQANVRGTSNAWATTPMELVADYTWRVTDTFGSGADERFKIDIFGDWATNFGDNNGDGVLEPGGDDIAITEGEGDYTITFNDQDLTYSVEKVVEPTGPIADPGDDIVVRPGVAVTFDGSASTGDAPIEVYSWTSAAWQGELSGVSPTFTFNSEGVFDVTLTVTDENGASDSAIVTVTVQANVLPTAVIDGGDITITQDTTITFDGSPSFDTDGNVATYLWDNGDTTVTSTRTFDVVGTFVITLEVTDNEGGSASTSITVTVEEQPIGVNVSFTCLNGHTNPGTSVYVVGNIPELGNWSVASAAQVLETVNYPQWQSVFSAMPANTVIEWKCVKALESTLEIIEWQSGDNNSIPTGSSGNHATQGSF